MLRLRLQEQSREDRFRFEKETEELIKKERHAREVAADLRAQDKIKANTIERLTNQMNPFMEKAKRSDDLLKEIADLEQRNKSLLERLDKEKALREKEQAKREDCERKLREEKARPAAPSKVVPAAPAAPAPRREEPTTRSPSGPSRASLKAEMMAVFTEIDDEEAGLVPRLDLRMGIEEKVAKYPMARDLAESIRTADAMILEEEDYEKIVDRWIAAEGESKSGERAGVGIFTDSSPSNSPSLGPKDSVSPRSRVGEDPARKRELKKLYG